MKVSVAAVISLDGFVKKNTPVHTRDWISDEDKKFFADLVAKSDVVVIGRKTYRNMRPARDPTKHYVVYTHAPEQFAGEQRADHVEFTNEDPRELLKSFEAKAYKNILVAGGGAIISMFLKANLADELFITVEPVIHGAGLAFTGIEELGTKLTLQNIERLNTRGTVLLHYKVER